MQGIVKWFNDTRGFGFLTPSDGSPDVFVHYSGIADDGAGRKTLKEGDKVEFEVTEGDRGPKAAEVQVIEHADTV